jgi:predicted ATPase/class 3 adenylate cyclase
MNVPVRTITFLFTDIEGSTSLWEHHPEAMRLALTRHDILLRQTIESNRGGVFKTVGDAFCASFADPADALQAALTAHLLLQEEAWGETGPLKVRMGLHTGAAEERDGDYFGQTLNRVARLQSVGHGQQTLVSHATYQLIRDTSPAATWADLGQHRLKDLLAPEQVWQVIHPSLPSQFPPLKSLDYLPTNLPRQMTSFIGREQEMAAVKSLLPSNSLLTLLGIGGAGKTRLAIQVGAEALENYKDGVWLVELAALADPALVTQEVAGVLGVREVAGRPLLQSVLEYLRDRLLLLIVDNCEHLLGACARLAQTLLASCPGLTILATSREPLGVAGEQPWRIPSLLTPEPGDLQGEGTDMIAALMEYDACRLFVERATVQRHDFELTRTNGPVVAHLCRQLDGIPLAIELAAARVRSLSVEEINNKLDHRFRLLTGGSRTALPRQQTLRALIDWSYDLLTTQEKTLLRRVSVFAGGWTLAAAEQVGTGESIEDWEVLDLLTSLADKSLVLAEVQGQATRYRLLETVRQYALERLGDSGEAAAIRGRHRDCFVKLVMEIEPELVNVDQARWLAVLEEEHDNVRQMLGFCRDDEEAGHEYLCLGRALWLFWYTRGHSSEGRQQVAAMLSHPDAQARTTARADALHAAGDLARNQGEFSAARPLHEDGLAIYREFGNQQGIAGSLMRLGCVDREERDLESARSLLNESLAINREIGNKQGIAASLTNLGILLQQQRDLASARPLYEESLTIYREIGNKQGLANALNGMGVVVSLQGDFALASSLYEESLAIYRELGTRAGIAATVSNLGGMALDQGDYTAARSLFEEGLMLHRELGNKQNIALTLRNLANVADVLGDSASARSLYQESLPYQREIGHAWGIAVTLQALASLAVKQEKWQISARLWGASLTLREDLGSPLTSDGARTKERDFAAIETALGQPAFKVALEEGRAMPLEQAVEYALEKTAEQSR